LRGRRRKSTPPLRKIAIINTADAGGGAERVSIAVLNGLLDLGLDAWLLVGNKTGDHPRVVPFHSSPFFDYRPYMDPRLVAADERRRVADRARGLEDLHHPYSHQIDSLTGSQPDLVLCHNLHGGYFDLRALPALSARLPVAMRLFDTWLLAGHCAYSLGCDKWRRGCGDCPDLTIPPAILHDASRLNLRLKQEIFQAARVSLCAESQWMLDRARQSVLAEAAIDWKLIPGGVDLATFYPHSRDRARRQLGLGLDTTLLLYVANGGAANRFKDFATVRRALAELRDRRPDLPLTLLVAGANAPDEQIGPGILIRHFGYVASQPQLAALYRASDLLVHSAFEETFGNVVTEALACGLPVVAASGGGVVELIEHGRTGLLAPRGHEVRLADAIAQLLDAPERAAEIAAAGAAEARRRFDARDMINELHAWCADIHSCWHARAGS
jgi:glycosyltransferase involved in cell wall biosynthesis